MEVTPITYRNLTSYKYQLMEDYTIQIEILPKEDITTLYIDLNTDGLLTIKKNYAWDGPSGPTVDTNDFMRGSLVHDALYQLMRGEYLDISERDKVDRLLQAICKEDGMTAFRAWYVYKGVSLFGKTNAQPKKEEEDKLFTAPEE